MGPLTLLNAGYFYNYLTRGGAQSSPPSNRPKNKGLRINHGWTLRYRQLLGGREKNGVDPPKFGPVSQKLKFPQKCQKSKFQEIYYLKFATDSTLSGRHD